MESSQLDNTDIDIFLSKIEETSDITVENNASLPKEWTLINKPSKAMQFWSWNKQLEATDQCFIKGIFLFENVSADTVFECLSVDVRHQWEQLPTFNIVEKNEAAGNAIVYQTSRKPPMIMSFISQRDFVLKYTARKNYITNGDGTKSHVVTRTSITSIKIPENKQFVRANNFISGMLIEPDTSINGCKLTMIMHSDLGHGMNLAPMLRWFNSCPRMRLSG